MDYPARFYQPYLSSHGGAVQIIPKLLKPRISLLDIHASSGHACSANLFAALFVPQLCVLQEGHPTIHYSIKK